MVDKLGKQLTLYFLIGTKYINETNLTSSSRRPVQNLTSNDRVDAQLWADKTIIMGISYRNLRG